jgi:hypothetical protein
LGIHPKVRWIQFLLDSGIDDLTRAKMSFLDSDIEATSEPAEALATIVRGTSYILNCPVIVQVDEIVDICLPERARCRLSVSKTPTLKLLLNNAGVPHVGLLCEPLDGLSFDSPGLKLKIAPGTPAHYGVLMLEATNTEVLGGCSPELVARRNDYASASGMQAVFRLSCRAAAGKIPKGFLSTWPETRFVAPEEQLAAPIARAVPARAHASFHPPVQLEQIGRRPPDATASQRRAHSEPPSKETVGPVKRPAMPLHPSPPLTSPARAPVSLANAHAVVQPPAREQTIDLFPGLAPPRRGLPEFRPKHPPLRVLAPGDLRTLPAAPQVRLVRVNARVGRVEFRFDGARFCIGAALASDVVVPVKQSLAKLLIGVGTAVWPKLPPFVQDERIRTRCEPRLCALEPPLLVIDRGGTDLANRFELTTGEHEIDATRF